MKKYILILFVALTGLSACKKTGSSNTASVSAAEQAMVDDANIQTYIQANNINAVKDASGLYYQVITAGTGSSPSANSVITVNYNGKLLDGTTFDSGNLANTSLTSLIKGWQIGIPHLKVGGRILLLIPSGLGYGTSAAGSIPANSVTVFTIDLISFKQ